MKVRYYTLLLGLIIAFGSCEKDNYNEPQSFLTGRVVYNGEPIQVGVNEVSFELWQPGFGKSGALGVGLEHDGSFSSRLFDGDYKLVFVGGQGPFRTNTINAQQLDTINVNLVGDKVLDIEVTPYYIFNSSQITNSGTMVSASCSLNEVITDANIERVSLYINNTQFVSNNNDLNIANAEGDFSDISNINLSVEIPEMNPAQNYVFARIGVKIAGVEDLLFSSVEKITF